MKRAVVRVWLVAFLLAGIASIRLAGAVSVSHGKYPFGELELDSLILENSFTRLIIVPDRGGRVVEWIDKQQGDINVVDLPNENTNPHYGGLLNEHGWASNAAETGELWNYTFEWQLHKEGPAEVVLEMWPEDIDLFRRTITMRADSPVIRVDLKLSNTTQEVGGNTLIRNVVWPSGGPNREDHVYSTPLTSGVQRDGRTVNTGQGARREAVVLPWRAFGSLADQRLVAFAFGDELFEGAYDWAGSVTRPTFEWFFHPVPPGKETTTTHWLYLAHGFSRAMHLTQELVVDFEPQRVGEVVEIDWAFASMDQNLKEVTIETTITDLKGSELARLEPVVLSGLEIDKRRDGQLKWQSATPAPVVIKQRIMSGERQLASYEQPFELGQETYAREVQPHTPVVFSDIPGWQLTPPLEVRPTAADRERGYILYLNEGPARGESLAQVKLTLGGDEYESFEICFKALADIGTNVVLRVELPAELPATLLKVSGAAERFVATIWAKDRYGWRLSGDSSFAVAGENESRFWLIANSAALPAGTYQLAVVLKPEAGPEGRLPVTLEVLPVKLPQDRHYFLEANTSFNQLGQDPQLKAGTRMWQQWEWDIPAAEVYADDFHAHGGRMVTAYGLGTTPGYSYANINLREDGRNLMAVLKEESNWLDEAAELPALDLSFWDSWLQVWLSRGFTRYRTTLDGVTGYWNQHGYFTRRYKVTNEQRVRRWLLSETARYLKEKGFRNLYTVIDDEIAPDKFDAWMKAAKDARECGWSPGVTISPAFFRNKELYHSAGPIMEYWVIGNPIGTQIATAKLDGYIVPGNSLGSYEGTGGGSYREYSDTRASRWRNVLAGMDVFWVQCYIRKPGETIVFHEDFHPYASATWEGMRDGVEDGNYLKAALGMIALLQQHNPSAAGSYSNQLQQIFASVDRFDSHTVRQAKNRLLHLLLELRPLMPEQQPSLFWEELPLIEAGTPRFKLAALSGAEKAAAALATTIESKTGIKLPVTKATTADAIAGQTILLGHPDDAPWLSEALGTASALGITPTYPAPETYAIVERQTDERHTILLAGRDAGLMLGSQTLGKMLKLNHDYPGQYFMQQTP